MKKLTTSVLFALLSVSCAWADVAINATNFPDKNFRNYLLSQRFGKDGVLTDEEIDNITIIDVSYRNIQSLEGIESFKELRSLTCNNNRLMWLDVSKNTKLITLSCRRNRLSSLDVTKNAALKELMSDPSVKVTGWPK